MRRYFICISIVTSSIANIGGISKNHYMYKPIKAEMATYYENLDRDIDPHKSFMHISKLLKDFLKGNGYLDSKVSYKDDKFFITLGDRYRIRDIYCNISVPQRLLPKTNVFFHAKNIEYNPIIDYLLSIGYPSAKLQSVDAIVDKNQKILDISYSIILGNKCQFGYTQINGLKLVKQNYIKGYIPWDKNDLYNAKVVQDFERILLESGLFSSIEISHNASVHNPITTIDLQEAKHRNIGASIAYGNLQGSGAQITPIAYWNHMNFFGAGERLETSFTYSKSLRIFDILFTKPLPTKDFIIDIVSNKQDMPAYLNNFVGFGAGIIRHKNILYGISMESGSIEPININARLFTIYSIRFMHRRQYKFSNIMYTLEPCYDKGINIFIKHKISCNKTIQITNKLSWSYTANLGLIHSRGDVIANKKFYAGGLNSNRGYAIQTAETNSPPKGGKQIIELGGEIGYIVYNDIGIGTFLDLSYLRTDSRPFTSTGIILFYAPPFNSTPIAPNIDIRLALGFPIDNPHNEKFKFYISIKTGKIPIGRVLDILR